VIQFSDQQWALILGGSSGFGLATAKKLAKHGMSVCIVHRDRRGAMARIEPEFDQVRAHGHGCMALNTDALSQEHFPEILSALQEKMGAKGRVRVLLHSIAFGNLKPLAPVKQDERMAQATEQLAKSLGVSPEALNEKIKETFEAGAVSLYSLTPSAYGSQLLDDGDVAHTIFAMGTSLISWVRAVFERNLFAPDARVLGLTSEGNEVAWRGYAAVSAAKTALEAAARSIAVEYAPHGIRCNIVQAGVTDTPAMRAIPGSLQMKANAQLRNPFRRLTQPEDVANFICLLCTDEAAWVNGAILRVDGGERISQA